MSGSIIAYTLTFAQAKGVPQGCVFSTALFQFVIKALTSILLPNIWPSMSTILLYVACAGTVCRLLAACFQSAIDHAFH